MLDYKIDTGSTTNNVSYHTEGNVIYGETTSKLEAKQAVTIRLQLPQGYFVGVKATLSSAYIILSYAIPITLLVISLIIF